jgi:4-amino-4-deoxy-L-arabinose transferase-like glycosyltransferase
VPPGAFLGAVRRIQPRQFPALLSARLEDVRSERRLVAAVLLLALLARVLFLGRVIWWGDTARYMAQADSLLRGEGYPSVSTAPVYPLFLAGVRWIWDSVALLLVLQILMSVGTCLLVYRAIRPLSRSTAFIAALLLALNPMAARFATHLLSETLTTLLVAVAVALAARLERGAAGPAALALLGFVTTLCVLAAPHTVFLVCGVLAWSAWRLGAKVAPLALGAAMAMGPWQLHCMQSAGRMMPWVYEFGYYGLQDSGYVRWVRTWASTPSEYIQGFFSVGRISEFPAKAFRSDDERRELLAVARAYGGVHTSGLPASGHAAFAAAAADFVREQPVRYFVVLPLLRAIGLWTYVEPVGFAAPGQVSYLLPSRLRGFAERHGPRRAVNQAVKASLAALLCGWHAVFLTCAVGAVVVTAKRGSGLSWALLAGVMVYTAAASFDPQPRRNLPLYPALLALASASYVRRPEHLRRVSPR